MNKTRSIDVNKLIAMCSKFDISFLGIFGSYIHGNFTSESDLDLVARFSKRKSLLDLIGIEREISEGLGVKVDLLTEKSISPYLKDRIMNELKVIYDQKG